MGAVVSVLDQEINGNDSSFEVSVGVGVGGGGVDFTSSVEINGQPIFNDSTPIPGLTEDPLPPISPVDTIILGDPTFDSDPFGISLSNIDFLPTPGLDTSFLDNPSFGNSGLEFLPDNVAAIPTTLRTRDDLDGNPLQALVAIVNGEEAIFDAASKVRIGTVQTVIGLGGTPFRTAVFGGVIPRILESPDSGTHARTAALTLAGVGIIGQFGRGAAAGIEAIGIFAIEEVFEAKTGIPAFNPLSLLRLSKIGDDLVESISRRLGRTSKANSGSLADNLVDSSRRPATAKANPDQTRGLQALQKKIDRGKGVFGTDKTQEAAERQIRDILDDAQSAQAGRNFIDIRDSAGRGVRIRNGQFDTLLDPAE